MTRTPLLRPTLLPGVPRIWRGSHTLQLGLDPGRAILLELPDPRTAALLDLLDGTRPERVVLARAAALGVPPDDARTLLDALHTAGYVLAGRNLLPSALPADTRDRLTGEAAALALRRTGPPPRVPAPSTSTPARTLRRRAAAQVVVAGRGRLGAPIAVALAAAGVGHVDPDLPGHVSRADLPGGPLTSDDVGTPRRAAVAAAVRRAAPEARTGPVRRGQATLVVQLGHDQPAALLAAAHAARRQAHLAVTVQDGVAVVGPLVPPAGGPCLNCLDLHRRERDTGWPGAAPGPGAAEPCAVTTLLAATAYAAAEALTYLDGGIAETLGGAVEIGAPGRIRRRTWPPHPDCGCSRTRGARRLPAGRDPAPGEPE
ncbi:ThiF family adenylyltransferase [Krasilnikovia sp. MM14-A1004]|uniref:ThiF family adenylyltransferase n=1 Tax=Krasilnikovia sp. MM14-A1004 TaxID=3373541 RepID=UPI00399D50E3